MKPEQIEKYMEKLHDISEKVIKADKIQPSLSALLALAETVVLFNEIYQEGFECGHVKGMEEGIRAEKEQTKLN